ncbi:MAG: M1 family metallopeptidase [Bacillota bacterium]|nr:M1 family metallopeptidase [Bacillota bacterium]
MKNKRKIVISLLMVFILTVSAALYFIVFKNKGSQDNAKDEKISESSKPASTDKAEKPVLELKGDRTAYDIDVTLDTENKTLTGRETVKLKNNNKTTLKNLVFHLYPDSYNSAETKPSIGTTPKTLTKDEIGDIKIDSLEVNNASTQYTEDDQILKVPLNKELKPGETAELTMDFTLKIPNDKDRLGYYRDQYSITNWYPILSIYDDKTSSWDENPFFPVGESNYSDCSDYTVEISVPKGMVVATTGLEVSKKQGTLRDKIDYKAENIRDFDFFAYGGYKVVSKEVDGVKVNSYYMKQETTAKRMLDLACRSLQFFNKTYGAYPYPEYDVVETYLEGGAMEYPTVTQMPPYQMLSETYNDRNLTFLDEAVVHETGHQWFYSTVGNNEFKEPVLDESFTSYATALFFEDLFGEYSPLSVKGAFLAFPMKTTGPISRSSDKYTWSDFEMVVYRMGPAALEDFRRKVGHEKFNDVFKTYYERYKFENATLEGFIGIVREKCGSEIADYVNKAFTSDDYSMDSMVLSKEELNKIQGNQKKN